MTEVLLSEMKKGQSGRVLEIAGDSAFGQRIREMGLTKGEPVKVVRFAPFGDPIEITIRGYLLSLRRDEARLVRVQIDESGQEQ